MGVTAAVVDLAAKAGSALSRGDYHQLIKAGLVSTEAIEKASDEALLACLGGDEVKLSLVARRALKLGDTDVFPRPCEYQSIERNWDHIRQYLVWANILEWRLRPDRTLLVTKAHWRKRSVWPLQSPPERRNCMIDEEKM